MTDLMHAGVLYGARDIRVESRERPVLQSGMVLIRVRRVGICGSDIHYFEEGRCGNFSPTRPFILGHELSGEIAEVTEKGDRLVSGVRVTVNPARACHVCEYCKSGRPNLCRRTIMLGSASTTPPTDGALSEYVAVMADQCHLLPDAVDDGLGAMVEPLAVALHAVKQAGPISGRRMLVTGGGPIGLLVAITLRALGAGLVVLSDIIEGRREVALRLAADKVLDPSDPELSERVRELTGDGFDAVFEASGSSRALRSAFDLVRPGGAIVQIGTLPTGDVPLPANLVMSKEVRFVGSFRYGDVFEEAIRLIAGHRVTIQPLISCVLPFKDLGEAIRRATARDGTMKVQIAITN